MPVKVAHLQFLPQVQPRSGATGKASTQVRGSKIAALRHSCPSFYAPNPICHPDRSEVEGPCVLCHPAKMPFSFPNRFVILMSEAKDRFLLLQSDFCLLTSALPPKPRCAFHP